MFNVKGRDRQKGEGVSKSLTNLLPVGEQAPIGFPESANVQIRERHRVLRVVSK